MGRKVTHVYLLFRFVLTILIGSGTQDNRERVRAPENNVGPSSKGWASESDRLSLLPSDLGLVWGGWFVQSTHNDTTGKDKMYERYSGPGSPSGLQSPSNLYRLFAPCRRHWWCCSVGVVTGLWTAEESGLNSRRRQYISILSKASEPNVRRTHLPVQWCLGCQLPECEADNSPPSNAEWRMRASHLPSPTYFHGVMFNIFPWP